MAVDEAQDVRDAQEIRDNPEQYAAKAYERVAGYREAAAYRRGHADGHLAGCAEGPRETPAGHDLIDFMDSCKAKGLRTAKGEFVASDGTRMPYDWSFERGEKKGREDG